MVSAEFNARLAILAEIHGADKVARSLNSIRAAGSNLNGSITALRTLGATNTDLAKAARKMDTSFRMEFLSMMFFGMQVRRVLGGVFKGIIGDFQKVAGSLHPLNVQFGILSATFTYLKYSIVEALSGALMNIMPLLVEWMYGISDWISDNPERILMLAKAFIVLYGAAFLLETIGQTMIFFTSFAGFAKHYPVWAAGLVMLGKAMLWLTVAYVAYEALKKLSGIIEEKLPVMKGFKEWLYGAKGDVWYMKIPLIRLLDHFVEALAYTMDKLGVFEEKTKKTIAAIMTAAELVNPLTLMWNTMQGVLSGKDPMTYIYDKWMDRLNALQKRAEELKAPQTAAEETIVPAVGELQQHLSSVDAAFNATLNNFTGQIEKATKAIDDSVFSDKTVNLTVNTKYQIVGALPPGLEPSGFPDVQLWGQAAPATKGLIVYG